MCTNVVLRMVKFQILDFAKFIPVLLTWGPLGVKVSTNISSESTHQVHSPNLMYTSGEGDSTGVIKIVNIGIFFIFGMFKIV